MKRRIFLMLLGSAAATWPLAARGQRSEKRGIAYLAVGTHASVDENLEALRQELRALGHGGDIEIRYANGDPNQLPSLAAELVGLAPAVIITGSSIATIAAKRATSTIPIVFAAAADPVSSGFVASLAHPGANITGLSLMNEITGAKTLELLYAAIPTARRIAVMFNPANAGTASVLRTLKEAAQVLGAELLLTEVRSIDEIDGAFATMTEKRPDGLAVVVDPITITAARKIAELAAAHKLPAVYQAREFVTASGLMSYGPSLKDNFRRTATYVDKIIKGAKPADLPVEQPTKFELVINLKTAKALGLTMPQTLLMRADEVIE